MSAASSSTSSERDERVFIAAFGLMDSPQDGEAIAAFMRARAILHRHGGGFRRMLERSHEAERLNEELGKQNAQLLRENSALRARDSRPVSSPANDARGPLAAPAIPEFRHWDIGLISIIGISTSYGLLGITASLTLIASILICAAFANWFSPIRFFAGLVLGLTALGMILFNRSASADARIRAVADAPAAAMPATTFRTAADPSPAPPPLIPADALPGRQAVSESMVRRAPSEPRSRRGSSPKLDCGSYRLQPGFTCPRSTRWGGNFLPDFGRPPNMRYN